METPMAIISNKKSNGTTCQQCWIRNFNTIQQIEFFAFFAKNASERYRMKIQKKEC